MQKMLTISIALSVAFLAVCHGASSTYYVHPLLHSNETHPAITASHIGKDLLARNRNITSRHHTSQHSFQPKLYPKIVSITKHKPHAPLKALHNRHVYYKSHMEKLPHSPRVIFGRREHLNETITPKPKSGPTEKPTKKPTSTTKKPSTTTKKPSSATTKKLPKEPTKKPNTTTNKPTKKPTPTTTPKPHPTKPPGPHRPKIVDCTIYKGTKFQKDEYEKLSKAIDAALEKENYPPERMEVWSACKQVKPNASEKWVAAFWDANTVQAHSCVIEFSHDDKTGKLSLSRGPACHVESVDLCPSQMLGIYKCKYPTLP